jgi:carboxylesterase type B
VNTYWFEFLRTGKPEAEGNPVWQSHDKANDITMEFGETIALWRDFMRGRLNEFIGFLKTIERISHR